MIAGGTGTGKTALHNALAVHIPDDDRIIVIEDTAEIHSDKPSVLRFEARGAQVPIGQEQPLPPLTVDLEPASLRHRRDRILVGEVRGAAAFDRAAAVAPQCAQSHCLVDPSDRPYPARQRRETSHRRRSVSALDRKG